MLRRFLLTGFSLTVLAGTLLLQAGEPAKQAAKGDEEKAKAKERLSLDEQVLANRFQAFEQSLMKLKERLQRSPRQEDRERAVVLQKALDEARESGIATQFEQLVDLLKSPRLNTVTDIKRAKEQSERLADELRKILAIVHADTQAAKRREQMKRLEELIKEIKRLEQEEKRVQGQTQIARTDPAELKGTQATIRGDTAKVAKALGQGKKGQGGEAKNSKGDAKDEGKGDGKKGEGKDAGQSGAPKAGQGKEGGKSGDGKQAQAKGGAGKESGQGQKSAQAKEASGSQGAQAKSGEPKAGQSGAKAGSGKQGQAGAKSGQKGAGQSASKSGQGQKSGQSGQQAQAKAGQPKGQQGDAKSSQSQQGQQSASKSGQSGQQAQAKGGQGGGQGSPKSGGQQQQSASKSDNSPQGPQAQDAQSRAQKRVAEATEDMHKAENKITQRDNPAATEDQDKAIKNLQDARKRLEDLLRQLREEELERLLADLKARCEKMLRMQIRVYDGTVSVQKGIEADKAKKDYRNHQQASLKLSDDEKAIVSEASKAIEMLEAEGSAVAFPEVFMQVREDMSNVQRRLGVVDTGKITQTTEEDIIATLREMIAALEKARQDLASGKGGKGGPPQDQKLLDQIAELKMIRSMQVRVNARTRLYGRQYEGEQPEDPNRRREVQGLADRQERIFDVTNRIVRGDNR